ncbi:hypothetical protein DFA_00122 [Cavenderia fasciculata]|uniref:Peptidoglycan binding-like domain-containing protein n=1 Tax=Cavenderia fasciculata TaxID=261658 RepID=F4PXN4_CACFS|nr:uncharacterized protein DFA_00122 [Cavenderia fasciculata]EGG19544.1 hypothetical protein DFA_00122 [Cavenderia fasciculata]|eukprot:XP_004357838.1 hypothetical protein DFA_00122 [Cavenderia fasciculata]
MNDNNNRISEEERKLLDSLNSHSSNSNNDYHPTSSSPKRIVRMTTTNNNNNNNRQIDNSDDSFALDGEGGEGAPSSSSSIEDPIEKELRRKMMSMLTSSNSQGVSNDLSKRSGGLPINAKKSTSPNNQLTSSLSGTASLTSSSGGLKVNHHGQQQTYDDYSSSSSSNLDELYVTCERERIKSYANDCKWELVSDNRILREYRMYAVEEWIFKSNHLWSAVEFTGNPRDEIIVAVFKPSSRESASSSQSNNQIGDIGGGGSNTRSLSTLFSKPPAGCYPTKTKLGQLIVVNSQMISSGGSGTSLSSSGTGLGLNFIALRSNQLGNDFDRYISSLKINLQLKRLGCMRSKYLLSYLPFDSDARTTFEQLSGASSTNLSNITLFVKELQAALSHLNYLPLLTRIDGQYDQKTINAVKAFQIDNNRKNGISNSKEVEGYIDQFTFKGIAEDINNLKRKLESLGYKPPNHPIKDYMSFNELMKNFQQKNRIYPDAPGKNILSYLDHIKDKENNHHHHHNRAYSLGAQHQDDNNNNNNNIPDIQPLDLTNNNNNNNNYENNFVNRNQQQQQQQQQQNMNEDLDQDDIKFNNFDQDDNNNRGGRSNNNNNNNNMDSDDEDDEYEYGDAESDTSKSEKSYMDSHSSGGYYESEGSGNDILPSSPLFARNKFIHGITQAGGSAPVSQISSPSLQHAISSTASASPSSSSPLIQSIQNRNLKLQHSQQNVNNQNNQNNMSSQQPAPIVGPNAMLHLSTDDEEYSDDVAGNHGRDSEDVNKLETPTEAEEKQKLFEKIKELETLVEQQQKDYTILKQEFEEMSDNFQLLRDRSAKALALFSTNEKVLEATNGKIGQIYKELPIIEEKVNINVDTLQSYSNRIKRLDDIVLSVQRKNERNILISFLLSIISLFAVAFAYLIMFVHKLKRKMVPSDKPPSSNEDIKRFISKQKLKITELIDDLDDSSNQNNNNQSSSNSHTKSE